MRLPGEFWAGIGIVLCFVYISLVLPLIAVIDFSKI